MEGIALAPGENEVLGVSTCSIIKCRRSHRSCLCRLLAAEEGYLTFGGKDAAPAPDAYEVLGVESKVDAPAARRQFMKLRCKPHSRCA